MQQCRQIYIYIYIYIHTYIHTRKANWIGHILRRNCLLQRVVEGKIKGGIEMTGRRGRRRRKLLDGLKERRGYCQLKEEALDRTVCWNRFGRGFGPVVRQTNNWIYHLLIMQEFCISSTFTYSMVQSPSWEANWFPASQESSPHFYGTRRLITALTSVRHLSLSWASPIQSTYPHPTSWRSIPILSTHLRLGLPIGLFPSGFPTKTLYTPLSSPIRATCPAHLILDFITRTILGIS